MVLGKPAVPGRPTNLDYSRARTYCTCSMFGGRFGIFPSLSFLSPFLWETARYRRNHCLKGSLNPKQPTNQSFRFFDVFLASKKLHSELCFSFNPLGNFGLMQFLIPSLST